MEDDIEGRYREAQQHHEISSDYAENPYGVPPGGINASEIKGSTWLFGVTTLGIAVVVVVAVLLVAWSIA